MQTAVGMALREFEDADGVAWRVWDTNPEMVSGLSLDMQRGWLTFDNGLERRRLSPIPAEWIELPAQRLVLLLRLAAPLRSLQSRTPTPAQPDRRIAELRLRPLTDPMKMNGCAMVMIGAPASVAEAATQAGDWIASRLGEAGGRSRVWRT